MNIADYKGVWVFAEQRDGELQKVALELLGKGRELADKLKVDLTAILLGSDIDDIAKELSAYGADKVLYADSPLLKHYTTDAYTKVISELVEEKKPEVLLIGASFIGRDLGPRLAAKLVTGLTADCTGLDIDADTNNLMMTRPAFGGNLMATIVCGDHRPQMSTVRPGVFEKLKKADVKSEKIEKLSANISKEDIKVDVQEVIKLAKDTVDIGEAKVIISGGRGIGDKEGFKVLQELADLLDGTVGGSRAAVDNGWIDKNYQVGQTGKTVRPGFYIAVGISGAIQHLAGMQDSGYILAINKDADAPIMKIADLAIVGDYTKVIPELIIQIKALN
ncbi:electron transfer flavoprotein subunit alpha [Clostridium tyrobutyricum]|jgi:electron transfer flavoprotein alpha subunit|uniref:Electron transfer flavoprotein, alpha subunit n=2 Tax=Clostridium tyrobutyricum TaxID=1519 RepID=W6N6H2_CLOTY|nr:electron transfer flavoprotein subunit alpha/FixB family protein [Clostridium tyrobutyricum]AIZ03738.1 electron transfer flavoprotein alpha/beta-subunit [Clostridium tyrobutyricum]AND85878.1 electron transfer flavoprotein subunit alpha [Clostridium tyrobutyricum]ANP70391.1 electron transfer flavoprotein subunit alpha [Clostridium tyrobutyricum]MBR9648216.1 electron transfer flavoprotein subunit alpha/FixB family protein [Clostridium tyrobutyricum]MBV4414633.1 electron transfer flavoprotein 